MLGLIMARTASVTVADEVWIATALLHREHPDRFDFTLSEIVARAEQEGVSEDHRPGLRPHASRHCVANAPSSPARHRLLLETGRSTRRLFRPGDPYHPDRRSGKTHPQPDDLPLPYRGLVEWYLQEWARPSGRDPLLDLYGTWKDSLNGQSPDDYVRELREGWE
jgi:hypothetical protein